MDKDIKVNSDGIEMKENHFLDEDEQSITSLEKISKSILDSISLSNTSDGVLIKWVGNFNGDNYYFKTGTINGFGYFTNRQPYAEMMAYRIGKQLKFPNLVKTFLTEIRLLETDRYLSQVATVSFTKDFNPNGQSSYSGVHYFITPDELKKNYNNLYNLISSKFSFAKRDLDIMILFDFIIANVDRHLNNFGFIVEGDNLTLSPLFDNGLSLLSNLSDDELNKISEFTLKKLLKCKPFSSEPKKQVRLIDLQQIPNGVVDAILKSKLDWDLVFEDLDLSELRKNKIIELVEWRLDYVKDLLLKIL